MAKRIFVGVLVSLTVLAAGGAAPARVQQGWRVECDGGTCGFPLMNHLSPCYSNRSEALAAGNRHREQVHGGSRSVGISVGYIPCGEFPVCGRWVGRR